MSARERLLTSGYARVLRPALFAARGGDPERIHHDMIAGLAALGVTDTVGMGPQVGGVPVVEASLVAVGLVILERAGRPARVH